MTADPIAEFRAAMSAAGLQYSGQILGDGKLHRFDCEGEKGEASGYILHIDAHPAGQFWCHRRGLDKTSWRAAANGYMKPAELIELRKKWRQDEIQAAAERAKTQAFTAAKSQQILDASPKASADHAYLQKKKVPAVGDVRQNAEGDLVLPLHDETGRLHSLQTIDAAGDKLFLPGGRIAGTFFTLCDRLDGPLIIAEGYATAATCHVATGWATVAALNCGNLKAVSAALRKLHPQRTFIIAADDDRFTKENPGRTKANEAANQFKPPLPVAFPEFSDLDLAGTDFNDLAAVSGISAVQAILTAILPVFAKPIGSLTFPERDDPSELLRHRYLCRRMSLLLIGPTGKGKSSLLLQFLACWSNGLPCFGIEPTRPLRSLYIQAENDDGDIAAIRDGICTGLKFDEDQRRRFFENVLIFTETALTGARFVNEIVRPLLQLHKPMDICSIDPALSYLGGDTKEQREVGGFLRNHLNPAIFDANCAAFLAHHTNKIKLSDETDRETDFAYYGSGSAEWANWARASLALEPKGDAFILHAGKRGQKLGWTHPVTGQVEYQITIAHSNQPGVIFWRQPDATENLLPAGGRPRSYDQQDLLDLLKDQSLSTTQWRDQAATESGISRAQFYRAIKDLATSGKVIKSAINGNYCLVSKS